MDGRLRLVVPLTKGAITVMKGRKLTFPTGVEEYLELQTEMPDNPKYFLDTPVTEPTSIDQVTLLR